MAFSRLRPARRHRWNRPVSRSCRLTVEALETRQLLSLQAVSLADSALFGASSDGLSSSPSISADGQLVAFESTADNLVDSATGGYNEQVYVGNATGGPARLVSATATGAGGNGDSTDPVISADGQFVVFLSDATDLVPEQVAAGMHLYETNLQSGTTTLVDVNTAGTGTVDNVEKPSVGADGITPVYNTPSVSSDGRYVVFTAAANDLTSAPAVSSGTITNVYVRDMVAATTTLVSVDAAGSDGGNGNSSAAAISADGSEVVFQSDASNLVATDTNNATDVFVRNLTTGMTSLVSANISNADSGDFESYGPVLSGDGNHVVFQSHADDLQSIHSHNTLVDIYERDLTTDVTTLISVNAAGTDSILSNASQPAVSDDGRYVAFVDNAPPQVYVRDTTAGTTALASVNLAGTAGDSNSSRPTLSSDGTVVAFLSVADDLVSVPTNGHQNLFVRNLTTGVTTLASVSAAGTAGGDNATENNPFSSDPAPFVGRLTPDGTAVAFSSSADDLVANDNNDLADVFVRNLAANTTTLVSPVDPALPAAYTSHGPTYVGAISSDGNSVAMNGGGPDLAETSGAGTIDPSVSSAAVSDLQTGTLTAFPVNGGDLQAGGAAALSTDGSVMAFQENTDGGLIKNVYTTAVPGGAPVLASTNAAGTGPGNADSFSPVLSGDGGTVVFTSEATNLVPNFVAGAGQSDPLNLYARNLATGVTTLVSVNAAGTAAGDGSSGSKDVNPDLSGNPAGYSYSVSADGRYVAFSSQSSDLTAIDTSANGSAIYVRDLQTGTTQLVDVAADGTSPANGAPFSNPVISADGRYVVFISNATNLVSGLSLPADNSYTYVRDLQTETTVLVSVDSLGNPIGADGTPSISADGQVITFASLYTGDSGGPHNEIYAYDLATGSAQLVSVNAAGDMADSPGNSYHTNVEVDPVVSANGNYVALVSTADNLAPGTFDGSENLYLRDLQAGTTTLVSANLSGTGGGTVLPQNRQTDPNPGVNNFAINADGSAVAFSSDQDDLVEGEEYVTSNVFLYTQGVTTPTKGSIDGQVFDDVNGDGTIESGENGLAGWTVYLDIGGAGHFVLGDPTATTSANGNYAFTNLAPGTYTVAEVVQPGYTQTAPPAPGTQTVTVTAGQTTTGPSFGDMALPVDLAVQSITVPATASPGMAAGSVSYTVTNEGGGAAAGDWEDAVYIATGTTINASSTLLAVEPHTGGLAAGASYTVQLANVNLPLLLPGSYHILVQVDPRDQVAEPAAEKGDELGSSSQTIAVTIPTLSIGAPADGAFTAAGQIQYYQITISNDENLLLTLASRAASGTVSISERFGALPAPGSTELTTAGTAGPNQTLADSPTQAGTYYIDVESEAGAAASAGYTLTATTPGLTVLGASPRTIGNSGTATLAVSGVAMGPGTTFTLTGPGGRVAASVVDRVDGSLAYVTFPTSGLAQGAYTLTATTPGGGSASVAAKLNVVPAAPGGLVVKVAGPSAARTGRTYAFIVTYTNTGNTDLPAPLLAINSSTDTLLGLSPGALDDMALQVLGAAPNGPAGVLRPGQQGQVSIFFQPGTVNPQFQVYASTTGNTGPVDYATLGPLIRPAGLTDAQWAAEFAEFQTLAGPTSGDFVRMLDQNATLLPTAFGSSTDVNALEVFEIARAQTALGNSIAGTLTASDPAVSLAGQTVIATNETTGDLFAATSLNDGSFFINDVAPGTYTFSSNGAIVNGSPTVTVAAGHIVTGVTVNLTLGGEIVGEVTAVATGAPAASPSVRAISADGTVYSVTGQPDGLYQLTGLPPGTYTVYASAAGLALESAGGVVVSGNSVDQNLSLPAQSVITGTVVPAPGGPTGGLLVVTAVPSGSTDRTGNFGTTSADGTTFTVPNLDPGTYDLTIFLNGYVTRTVTGVVVAAGASADAGSVTLALAATVSGTVTSSDPGLPAAGAVLGLFQGDTPVISTQADASGRFQFVGVPAGTYAFGLFSSTDVVTAAPVTVAGGDALTGVAVSIAAAPNSPAGEIRPADFPGGSGFNVPAINQELTTAQALLATLQQSQKDLATPQSCPDCQFYADYLQKVLAQEIPPLLNQVQDLQDAVNSINAVTIEGAPASDDQKAAADLASAKNDASQYFSFEPARSEVQNELTACQNKCNSMPKPSNPLAPLDVLQPPLAYALLAYFGFDPNEMSGPGFGPAGFVAADTVLPYQVGFENDPTKATAPAQDVTITEALSSSLDWTTFALGDITFGANVIAVPAGLQSYSTSVDTTNTDGTALVVDASAGLNLATGVVTWTFRSVDPATGELPSGVQDGFLPVEDGSGRGIGAVDFTILPKSGLATGTAFSSTATVVFDTNAPLNTNTVLTTIDAGAPTSTVSPLPADSPPQFTVTWVGADPGGSGIASYNVFVSTDGGPFTPFALGTTSTSALFTGAVGHSYAFYSVATGNVGNVQPTPATAQAVTTVVMPAVIMPAPLPVTVQSVLRETVRPKKHKPPVKVLVVSFSGALGAAGAQNRLAYQLVIPAKAKKSAHGRVPPGKKVVLASAVYSAIAHTVTLTPKAKLPTGTLQLSIIASAVFDAEGRPIDGDRNGQPGGNFVATIKGAGAVFA